MSISLFFLKRKSSISLAITMLYVLVFFFTSMDVFAQNASVKEAKQTIKTYPYSDPNPIPSLGINSKVGAYYPYYIFDGFSDKGVNQDWKVVTLENDFIEVTVLPGVGGKVMGAIEKSTGKEFIYLNHVLKFRSIGIRGPWTSGGIEHNFGLDLGHAPWTAADVDYVLKENEDGSVSCVVGGLDLASRSQWRVDIRLPKDKAYFETNAMWYNPTPLHDAYLSWEVAAYKGTEDLQFYFPGGYHIGHGGDVSPWFMDKEGRNLSMYRENNFGTSKSYHVAGMFPNWFGGYFHNTKFGSGHWAPYDDAPGKKLWIWSLARDGGIWEDLLTDNDGQYIEAQSGVKFNQASPEGGFNTPYNQLFMRPFYTETKSDYWFPVKETGGMVDASQNGTLNLVTSSDGLTVTFCPNIYVKDSLIVKSDGELIMAEFIDLKPMQLYEKTISLSNAEEKIVTVDIGKHLMNYTTDVSVNTIDRPTLTPTNQDFNSAEHLFRQAEDMNSMRSYAEAMETYMACLEKEPTHSRALAKVAELYYRRAQYEKGLTYAYRALENNTYDPGANFIAGVIHKAQGNQILAKEAFSTAVRSMEFRSASYVQIAGLHLADQNNEQAKVYAQKALDYNRYNITAHEVLITAFRKLNELQGANQSIKTLLEIDPLNHYARFEAYLLSPSAEKLSAFTSAIRNEMPFETYLELALEYANQGLNEEAIQVLEQSPTYPTVNYWLAYLNRNTAPDKSTAYLKHAVELSPQLVFPFRLETIPVLQWAQQQNTSWKTNYYLGLIYWKILRSEEAKAEFEKCGENPDFAIFYTSRGILSKNGNSVDNDFKKAIELNPEEWRTWYYLSLHYGKIKAFDLQVQTSKQMYAKFPDNPIVGIAHATALLNTNQNYECLKVLEEVNVLPAEFANSGHSIYERANISIALDLIEKKKYKKAIAALDMSKKWPENLGSGQPYEPDNRLQDYMQAYCEAKLRNDKMADSHYQDIIDYSRKHWDSNRNALNTYLSILVMQAAGTPKEVDMAMKKWEERQDYLRDWKLSGGSDRKEVQWVLAKYTKDGEAVKRLEEGIVENQPASYFSILLRTLSVLNN